MAALGAFHRPPPASSATHHVFASRVLLLLTALPLALASLAFVLQWRGGVDDPASRWPSADARMFPGMDNSPLSSSASPVPSVAVRSASDCVEILGGSSSPSFPYYRDWKFDLDKDLKPKVRSWPFLSGFRVASLCLNLQICITTSTSAGLEQIIPWLFYHKVLGVSQFLLFVEGKAAKPHVSAVLESIPVIFGPLAMVHLLSCSRIWNETWLAGFFYKPCNYELFVKQSLNMEMAIVMARESSVERDDIKDPFSEVDGFSFFL
ncbi:hypothetical protein B296_00034889 [Ensete ventricosum]|uniref:Uncharacterized protein n=1 Tax=Ensete ventricosum TaxID=4639 RepID=A0A426ZPR3_ENSVE|nr:hypothetical protein B296_00034889 [Ensete ventricosum]